MFDLKGEKHLLRSLSTNIGIVLGNNKFVCAIVRVGEYMCVCRWIYVCVCVGKYLCV